MKKAIIYITSLLLTMQVQAQDNVYPTPASKGTFTIANGTIHVGNGQVIENGSITITNGVITKVGAGLAAEGTVVNAAGKHIYPGLILSNSDLGLNEIGSGVRGSNDYEEIGDLNPSIRSIVAYNTDSKVIGVLRSNGILLASVTPQGGTISGSSSVVQLDAWNWEDAAYKMENGIHFNMPSLFNRPNPFGAGFGRGGGGAPEDPVKAGLEKVAFIKAFLKEAKAYQNETTHAATNLKYEALKGLFTKQQKLFVHCDIVKEMLVAIDFAKEFDFEVVIVGGSESYQIADLLKQNNIAVVLSQSHSLPTAVDDDVDQPFKTPAMLQKAGVLFSINDGDETTRFRNLAFNAGTAASYGLSKEEALSAITLNAAKILGVANKTGSLEVGKDANIVIAQGDILDMRSCLISHCFIQGRQVSLDNKQKQLNERYKSKYGIK
jgi:imidazolonepropionase-like amidohydrolase